MITSISSYGTPNKTTKEDLLIKKLLEQYKSRKRKSKPRQRKYRRKKNGKYRCRNNMWCWYSNGKLHRHNNPAVIGEDTKEYWLCGKRYGEKNYYELLLYDPYYSYKVLTNCKEFLNRINNIR